MSETPKEATNPNPQAPTSSRGLEQMTTQASNISLSDPKDCGTDIDTSTPHRPATDILSRLPLEITFQVLEQLSDKEKIKATRVCKSWESIAKTWQKENCQTILKKYGPIIDSPKFGWTKFRNAVKLAHIKPSSTPSGKLTHDSSNVHFVNSKKYAAWMNGKGFVTARLRPTTSVKPGESRTENETSYKLSTLLGCSNAQIFGEILSVEDSGCVLVAVGRYLKAPKKNGPKPEHCEKAIVGLGFSVLISMKRESFGLPTETATQLTRATLPKKQFLTPILLSTTRLNRRSLVRDCSSKRPPK
ncbi:hypothetical protein BJ508DRAFT_68749 [Ascobolus immersus RN42]|uniref:F-box domain-containing protein n=1 Tax=Ascobolus immersus RN42 TaxID=1160509 RepID=A0A3N4HKM0_ASCIM|nr:hypothetical protein BJ508DRAFT_68749 [Ascobolus immersus RN42]